MTALDVYTDWFPKSRMEFFTDFASSSAPFGNVISQVSGVSPSVSYSNKNADEFGSVTFTLPATQASGYARAAVYLNVPVTGGIVDRVWRVIAHDCMFESRAKATLSANTYIITSGFALNHNNANIAIAQDLVGFYARGGSGATWKAAVVVNYVLLKEIDTGIPISSYCTLRTEVSDGGKKASMIANGRTVMKYAGTEIYSAVVDGARLPMPSIELRDRTPAGSNGTDRSFECDYLYYTENVRR